MFKLENLPKKLKPAMLLMCGDHGIAKHRVSAFSQEVTLQMMVGYSRGTAAANVMAEHAGADIFVVDVGTAFATDTLTNIRHAKIAYGTNDFTQDAAMNEKNIQAAMAVGMEVTNECIKKDYNLFITAEMGIGNTTSSAALISSMLGLSARETVGRGSGINDERLKKKIKVVVDGIKINNPTQGDGVDCLKKLGGFEHAALVGAMLEAAKHKLPTIIDGVNATAAALCAWGIDKKITNYLIASHASTEPGQKEALCTMKLKPFLDAGMHLGEGTGACLLVPLLKLMTGKNNA